MTTLFIGLLVGGILLVVVRAILNRAEGLSATDPPPGDAPPHDEPPDPLDDLILTFLPLYIRPGHGFLVLRDRTLDRLELDGLDVGDPDAPHADFGGGFRGYFNVPPGPHTVAAHFQGKLTTWTVEVEPNRAYVKRIDWGQGGWVDDDPETEEQYQKLALSGSMLEAKALRPWPRPSLFFIAPPRPLLVNGRALPFEGKFSGLVNLPPGDVRFQTSLYSAGCTLPAESMQVVDFGSGKPEFVEPMLGEMLVRTHLRRAPRDALVTHGELEELPTSEERLEHPTEPTTQRSRTHHTARHPRTPG